MNDIIPGHARRGQGADRRRRHLRPGRRRRRAAAAGRDGVPEVEPVPEVDLRERRLRAADQRHGREPRPSWPERVEESLQQAALWDEVKDRLHESALALSGGQQQRLCIARALAVRPEILLMDEPASALDPIATQRIEELIYDLKKTYTIVIVTHNMQQAARVSDYTAFFWLGPAGRVRSDRQDLHGPGREADRGLRDRDGSDKHGTSRSDTSRRSSRRCRRGCSRWAAWPRSACARPCNGLVARDTDAHRQGAARRRADQRAAHRGRQPLLQAAGAAPADGHRPARDRRGGEDQHRPRAGRRPGGQHRRGRHALHQPPAGQEADRHPADGRHRAGDAARRARRLRPARHARWRTRCSTRTTGSTP